MFKVFDSETQMEVALKRSSVLTRNAQINEILYLSSFSHPNIIKFYRQLFSKPSYRCDLDFLLELGLSSLDHYIKNSNRACFSDILQVALNIASGLSYLEPRGIVHCDLKPGNIIICLHEGKLIFKIADFGAARPIGKYPALMMGTFNYTAPEFFKAALSNKKLIVSSGYDLFCLGLIIFELMAGQLPYAFLIPGFNSGNKPDLLLSWYATGAEFLLDPLFFSRVDGCCIQLEFTELLFTLKTLLSLKPIDRLSPEAIYLGLDRTRAKYSFRSAGKALHDGFFKSLKSKDVDPGSASDALGI